MKNILIISALCLLTSSCTKEITINLDTAASKIVIEGSISDTTGPHYVQVSKSVSFSNANTYPAITDAQVTISNGTTTETLIHTTNGIYKTQNIIAQVGNSYTLTVIAEGKTYTAVSKVPTKVPLLDLKALPSTFNAPGQSNTDSNYNIFPIYLDPAGYGNNYRFKMTINGERKKNLLAANDNVADGSYNPRPIFAFDLKIKKGDTVAIDFECIDLATYDYINTINSLSQQGPGGGATPANPPSNISGGALGYFSAHTSQRKQIIVQ